MLKSFQGASVVRKCLKLTRRSVVRSEATSALSRVYPRHDDFSERHVGPSTAEKDSMLQFLELQVSARVVSVHPKFCETGTWGRLPDMQKLRLFDSNP